MWALYVNKYLDYWPMQRSPIVIVKWLKYHLRSFEVLTQFKKSSVLTQTTFIISPNKGQNLDQLL